MPQAGLEYLLAEVAELSARRRVGRLRFSGLGKAQGLRKGCCQRAFADRPVVSERSEPERPTSPHPSICSPILSVASHDEIN